jgi:tetratricopeptide (TPR) repeat protein
MSNLSLKIHILVLLTFVAIGDSSSATATQSSCEQGEAALEKSQFAMAVSTLSDCLTNLKLDGTTRKRALQVRAWAYFSLHQDSAAVLDQEASFKVEGPKEYREFINYSSYLRRVARHQDSLRALRAAERIDQRSGRLSMMTQYNLGWTLAELRRYDDAVRVFTKAIPLQPEFPFVYWRRALALEALGRTVEAKEDIESAARILMTGPMKFQEDDFTASLRKKIQQYGLQQKYPI